MKGNQAAIPSFSKFPFRHYQVFEKKCPLYTEQKKLAAAVSRAASNINQICRRINSTGHVYEDDVAELKARQAEIWELLKVRQRDEL